MAAACRDSPALMVELPRSFETLCRESLSLLWDIAAVPHVAAVAALMLQFKGENRSLTPAQIYSTLTNTAIVMDDPSTVGFDVGFDFGTGSGPINASAALNAFALLPSAPVPQAPVPIPAPKAPFPLPTPKKQVPVATPKAPIPAPNAAAVPAP
jgi:hypothetical protein